MSSHTDHTHPVEAAARPRKRLAIALVGGAILLLLGMLVFVGIEPQKEETSTPADSAPAEAAFHSTPPSFGSDGAEKIEASLLSSSSSTPKQQRLRHAPSAKPSRAQQARTPSSRWYPYELTVRSDVRWIPMHIRPLESGSSAIRHSSTLKAVIERPFHPQLPPLLD